MNEKVEQDRGEWVKPELVDIDAGQGDVESGSPFVLALELFTTGS